MFFELSNGIVINLDQIKEIPTVDEEYSPKHIIMTDGKYRYTSEEDVQKIRDICLSQ